MTRKHKTQVDELERQIQWFTENQELVADRDAKFRRQARRIEELDGELAKAHRELARFQPAAGVTSKTAHGGTPTGTPNTKTAHLDVRDTNSAGVASLLGGIEPGTEVTASAVFDAGLAKVSLFFLISVWPIRLTPCLFTRNRTPSRSPRWSERYDRPRHTSSASPRSRRGAGACRTSSTPPTASTSGRCGRCSRST